VPVAPDELVDSRVAVGKRRLDQRPREDAHLAGSVGVLLVEVARLPDQAPERRAERVDSPTAGE